MAGCGTWHKNFCAATRVGTYYAMLEDVRNMEKSGGLQKQVGSKWAERRSFFLQILVLSDTFCMAFYYMHTSNVLSTHYITSVGGIHLAFIGSFVANFAILLPNIVPRIVLVDSFYCLNHEALDGALMTAEATAADLQYMFKLWIKRGEPKFAGADSNLRRKDFAVALKFLGMGASKDRMRRMFDAFDRDGNGTLDMQEVMSKFNEMKAAELDGSRTATSVTLQKADCEKPSSMILSTGSPETNKEVLDKLEHLRLQLEGDMVSVCHAIENLKQEVTQRPVAARICDL